LTTTSFNGTPSPQGIVDGRSVAAPPAAATAGEPGHAVGPALARKARSIQPWGTIVNAATGYPLADVTVRLRATGSRGDSVMGKAVTDSNGGFRIAFIDKPWVQERLLLVAHDGASCALEIDAFERSGRPVRWTVTSVTAFPLTLALELPSTPLAAERWQDVGARLEHHRIADMHNVARELIAAASASAFGNMDLAARQRALVELEQAFLDPHGILREHAALPTFHELRNGALMTLERALQPVLKDAALSGALVELKGKVAAYRDLLEVDWVLDPVAISRGDLAAGVTAYADLYVDIGTTTTAPAAGPTDFSRYRDYLRTIYTGGPASDTYAPNLKLLKRRLHQDFTTFNSAQRPANELLIAIVRQLLTASKSKSYGFGLPSGSIQARGTRTAREYLDYLIGCSQLSAEELGRRYRLNLHRGDAAMSSPVAENIATLQRFFSDGFQDPKEPSPAVPPGLRGRAPFFLYMEEWQALQRPFFPENVYQPALTFTAAIAPDARAEVKSREEWLNMLAEVEDGLAKATTRLDQGEIALARDALLAIDGKARDALMFASDQKMTGSDWISAKAVSARLEYATTLSVKTPDDLTDFITHYRVRDPYTSDPSGQDVAIWLTEHVEKLCGSLIHLISTVIPTLLGDCAFGVGDYATAISNYQRGSHMLVARAQLEDVPGSHPFLLPSAIAHPEDIASADDYADSYAGGYHRNAFYTEGGLPYTVDLEPRPVDDPYQWLLYYKSTYLPLATAMHDVERKFLRLRQGHAMLEWADSLYRTDEPSNIQRARELYKSVLWLHGASPTLPQWDAQANPFYSSANPALKGQRSRAWLGMEQIAAGLNWYGSNDALVPALRYKPQKEAADRYAAAARSAQQDFLLSTGKLEDSIREGLVNVNTIKKAALQQSIATEQVGIAEFGVHVANLQVQAVEAQMKAKQAEIDDHDDLFTQFGDVVSGFASVVGGMPGGVSKQVGTGVEVGSGLTSSEAAGMSAALGGACVLGAMAAFVAIGCVTLDGMADAQATRRQQLNALRDKALPLAVSNVEAKQREVTIAHYQQQIATADIDLARTLIQFQQSRALNEKLWSEIAGVMRRVMRRYLDLAGRYGWLAERALAYEQDRPLDIIRFDYFPETLLGVTGADLLQAGLGELDAARLDGINETMPVKRTFSLLADFPLQFTQLKQTGRSQFMTREDPFRHAYPGTYGYRIRSVTITPRSYSGIQQPRGMLTNIGLSVVSRADGSTRAMMRPSDALPLSEFRLAEDMSAFGIPDEALLAFEGSGIETLWELTLPALANSLSLDDLADIELTFDLRAQYSPRLRATHLASQPKSVSRLTFFSARAFATAGLEALRDPEQPSATVSFDLPAIGRLPRLESNRTIRNVVLLLPGAPLEFDASFAPLRSPGVLVPFAAGVAHSNAAALAEPGSQAPPSPLNVLEGGTVDTTFQLTIAKNGNATAFTSVADVLLGIEYDADVA
jgi:hypothetical protein